MATYDTEIAALADVTAGQTLAEAGGVGHAAVENRQNDALRAVAGHLDVTGNVSVGLTIVELSVGVWSADAPAGRVDGQFPILFVPYDADSPTDPADATNGIATPANIRSWDRLGPVTVGSL